MGYESKIKIFDVHSIERENQAPYKFGELITEFNLCKMGGNDFLDTFKDELDFNFYDYEYDVKLSNERQEDLYKLNETRMDKYDDVCRTCSVQCLISALERFQKEQGHYRRITPLLAMLKGFDESEWENLVCVHYGY